MNRLAPGKQDLDDLISLCVAMASTNNRCGKITIDLETHPNRAWVCLKTDGHQGDCTKEDVRKVVPF